MQRSGIRRREGLSPPGGRKALPKVIEECFGLFQVLGVEAFGLDWREKVTSIASLALAR
jgi:hypothetical protein